MQINKDLVISGTNITLGDIAYKDIYSTTETKTNKVWIDGKPIYRKVINNVCGNLLSLLNELNINFLIDVKGNVWSNYNHKMPINTPNPEPPNYVFGVYQTASNNHIEVFYNTNYFSDRNKVICIVEYTKTTD